MEKVEPPVDKDENQRKELEALIKTLSAGITAQIEKRRELEKQIATLQEEISMVCRMCLVSIVGKRSSQKEKRSFER